MADTSGTSKRLSIGAASRMLGVSTPTLKKRAREGLISFYAIGGRMIFDEEEIESFLRSSYSPRRGAHLNVGSV
jgi:excisionase family DNA binding protein